MYTQYLLVAKRQKDDTPFKILEEFSILIFSEYFAFPSRAVFFVVLFVTFLTEHKESISFPVCYLPSIFSWHFLISVMANPQIFSFMVSTFDFIFRKPIHKNYAKIYPFVFWYFYCFSLAPYFLKNC